MIKIVFQSQSQRFCIAVDQLSFIFLQLGTFLQAGYGIADRIVLSFSHFRVSLQLKEKEEKKSILKNISVAR